MTYQPSTLELKNVVDSIRDLVDPMICGFVVTFGTPLNATVFRLERGESVSDIHLTPLWDVIEGEVVESSAECPKDVAYIPTAPNRGYFECGEGVQYLPLLT
jgi:hypothetical protein